MYFTISSFINISYINEQTIDEVKLHSDAWTWNAKSHLMYESKVFCGSINNNGMWTKITSGSQKCVKIPWLYDILLKSYLRKTVCYVPMKYIVEAFFVISQNSSIDPFCQILTKFHSVCNWNKKNGFGHTKAVAGRMKKKSKWFQSSS